MHDDTFTHESTQPPRLDVFDLPPPDFIDPVIEAYKKDVDRSLLRENLKLTIEERLQKFENFMQFLEEARRSIRKSGDRLSARG